MADSNWLSNLNPRQREAVTYGNGPLLVVAGAGTGKTMTLAFRVAHLIESKVPPERILLLTFTRRAAEEMIKRATSAVRASEGAGGRVWSGTFHAVANRLLRAYSQSAGLSPDFTILDRSDAEDLLDVIRTETGLATKESRFPRKSTCMDIYTRRVNGSEDLESVLKKYFPWCQMWENDLKSLFREYVKRKQDQNVLDYDDLLLYWYHIVQDERMADLLGGRFDHILVDEYQDTNSIQAGILMGMRRTNRNITVVGDDAQSIYGFRSATVRNMLDFPKQFPGARIVTLDQNYRSVKPILDTTNLVIAHAKERYAKDLWSRKEGGSRPQLITCADEPEQDEIVVRRVLEHYEQGIPLRRQAVLFRAASHSASLEIALSTHNIPFRKYGGLKFIEAAHIKDLVAFLRIVENPKDQIAWNRVLQLVKGIGPATAASVFAHISKSSYDPADLGSFNAAAAVKDGLAGLAQLMGDLRRMDDAPAGKIDRIRRFYDHVLEERYGDTGQRASDIEHLEQIAARYQSCRQFLSDLVLDPPVSTGDLAGQPTIDEDWLVLSTIHSAKGLEWDAVYLIHAADGNLPSDMATGSDVEIEEELRLAYVAMTRARDFLYVLWPLRYYHKSAGISDKHSYAQCSRFFTPDVVRAMDQVTSEAATRADSTQPDGELRREIARHILDMWK
jgi:DNA helicase II / ATP-dependent DNA helicase PcrA